MDGDDDGEHGMTFLLQGKNKFTVGILEKKQLGLPLRFLV